MTTPDSDPADDPRLLAAVREYQALLESGRRPRRDDFLSRYPDLASVLADCLDGLELVRQAAGPAPPPRPAPAASLPRRPRRARSSRRRCPRGAPAGPASSTGPWPG